MSIYKPNPVSIEPETILRGWRVFEVQLPLDMPRSRHFAGFNEVTGDGRVSSPIMEWDPHTHTGVTRSGRVYKLLDGPCTRAEIGDAEWIWDRWRRINSIPDDGFTEVSDEYSGKISDEDI